jgi:peptidoglycan/xylan/chitin deacetylase (PgdA/CDA1 family)
MYHDVVDAGAEDTSGFAGRDAALYKIAPGLFEAHLDAIAQSASGSGRAPSPLFTFDDGGISAMMAADALETRGFTGHFFITANYIGTRGFLTRADLIELRRRGHGIGSHSCSHPLRMGHCGWSQLIHEWSHSRATLSDILGEDVQTASVPGGDFSPMVAKGAAKAGYVRLFTSEPSRAERHAFGMTLTGRFTIQRWTSARTAASLAAGEWRPCATQAIVWNAKKLTKRLAGERYLKLRRLLLRPGSDVKWGDTSA